MVQRLTQLMFVWDEELVASIMDLLYHYTNLYGSVGARITQAMRSNIVKVLIKFLAWKWRGDGGAQGGPMGGGSAGANQRPPSTLDMDGVACFEWYVASVQSQYMSHT